MAGRKVKSPRAQAEYTHTLTHTLTRTLRGQYVFRPSLGRIRNSRSYLSPRAFSLIQNSSHFIVWFSHSIFYFHLSFSPTSQTPFLITMKILSAFQQISNSKFHLSPLHRMPICLALIVVQFVPLSMLRVCVLDGRHLPHCFSRKLNCSSTT